MQEKIRTVCLIAIAASFISLAVFGYQAVRVQKVQAVSAFLRPQNPASDAHRLLMLKLMMAGFSYEEACEYLYSAQKPFEKLKNMP